MGREPPALRLDHQAENERLIRAPRGGRGLPPRYEVEGQEGRARVVAMKVVAWWSH
jgi:hypothetical protein